MRRSARSGAGATEYVLVISALVTATTAGAFAFVPSFRDGVGAVSNDVSHILANQSIGNPGGAGLPSAGGGSTDDAPPVREAGEIEEPPAGGTEVIDLGNGRTLIHRNGNNAGVGGTDDEEKFRQRCGAAAVGFLVGVTEDEVFARMQDLNVLVTEDYRPPPRQAGFVMEGIQTGLTSLAGVCKTVNSYGKGCTVSDDVSVAQLDATLEDGKQVIVTIDVDANSEPPNQPVTNCAGRCGHDVVVQEIWTDSDGQTWVNVYDPVTGQSYRLSQEDFDAARAPHGKDAAVITPQSQSA